MLAAVPAPTTLPDLAQEMMEPVGPALGQQCARSIDVTQPHPVSSNVVHVTFTAQSGKGQGPRFP
jgi:hypothetical protein